MLDRSYGVVEILAPPEALEIRGSREKFWITVRDSPVRWLFKLPRPNTGEHWAEKIAAEIGTLIGVNCARVELARCVGQAALLDQQHGLYPDQLGRYLGKAGTICRSFDPIPYVHFDPEETACDLLHGFDVLEYAIYGYDSHIRFGQRDHSIKAILEAFTEVTIGQLVSFPQSWETGLEELASYALLDGLIGNTDRHHENWMVAYVRRHGGSFDTYPEIEVDVMPSFDHASSLGRELTDLRRCRILESNGVLHYLYRGQGGVFVDSRRKRALPPLCLARILCRWRPEFTEPTLANIAAVPNSAFQSVIDRIPHEIMSGTAKELAYQIVVTSKAELLRSAR
jgi:hypothetical protein